MKEISILDIENIHIGNYTDEQHATGCTVLLFDKGAIAGVDVRGGAPATRETALLNPLMSNDRVDAIVLSGGSAFGLDACSGVAQYLEERNRGFKTDDAFVPIVCGACLYDLELVDASVRPNKENGYQACLNAEKNEYQDGCYGAGTGAIVGKFLGMDYMMKSGIGSYAVQVDNIKIGALVALNAAGNIIDPSCGKTIAGVRNPKTGEMVQVEEFITAQNNSGLFNQNTTLGILVTNAKFNKTELTKIAGLCHDGYARAINPVHTMYDGDAIFAMSVGEETMDITTFGLLAANVISQAILKAARPIGPTFGLPVASE